MRPKKLVMILAPNPELRHRYTMQLRTWGYAPIVPKDYRHAAEVLQSLEVYCVLFDGQSDATLRQLGEIAHLDTRFIVIGGPRTRVEINPHVIAILNREAPDFAVVLRDRIRIAVSRKTGPKPKECEV